MSRQPKRPSRELRLEAQHTHLYPGARGRLHGSPPGAGAGTCEVAFSDGSLALGSLKMEGPNVAVLETGPYITAAGTAIPVKKWGLEVGEAKNGARPFRVRKKLALA